jgi:cation diffusion facilitator family transporter
MQKKRNQQIFMAGFISIAGNLLLFILKFWGGFVSGSVAIMADAWHTLSDSLSSVVVLIGAKISHRPADKEHPFGHGRAELIAAILIGMMLMGVSWEFLTQAFENLQSRHSVEYGWIPLMVVVVSIVSKEIMAQYAFFISKKYDSESVRADGWHHRSDALSSLVILAGIFLGRYFWWIDSFLAALVALLILYSAYEIIRDASSRLMGNPPSIKTVEKVRQLGIKICSEDLNIHHIHMHEYGTHREMTLHIELPGNWTLDRVHNVANELEKQILHELDIEATVHIDPAAKISSR